VAVLLATMSQARIVIEEGYFCPVAAVPAATPLPVPAPTSAALPSNLPRFWTDVYATDSAGYCPYVAGYGWTGNLAWPVVGSVPDGRDFHPGHKGIDIEVPEGTPVTAAQAGTVIWSGYSQFGGGLIVVLAHGGGWRTVYAHLSELQVACGQAVAQGSQIGLSGKTGTSWYHVHFAVERDANAYDPLDYLVVITPN
jgi:murein DD-endopeptidase MepM/ murein hydrolase activator NlpD